MKFNFSNSKAAAAARASSSSFTLFSIVSAVIADWANGTVEILATTLIGRTVSRKVVATFTGEASYEEIRKAIKAGHDRNRSMAPCEAERVTPCYIAELEGNVLTLREAFPSYKAKNGKTVESPFPQWEAVGQEKVITLSDTTDTDLLAAEAWQAIKSFDPVDPKPGTTVFSQHCVQGFQVATFKAAYMALLSK